MGNLQSLENTNRRVTRSSGIDPGAVANARFQEIPGVEFIVTHSQQFTTNYPQLTREVVAKIKRTQCRIYGMIKSMTLQRMLPGCYDTLNNNNNNGGADDRVKIVYRVMAPIQWYEYYSCLKVQNLILDWLRVITSVGEREQVEMSLGTNPSDIQPRMRRRGGDGIPTQKLQATIQENLQFNGTYNIRVAPEQDIRVMTEGAKVDFIIKLAPMPGDNNNVTRRIVLLEVKSFISCPFLVGV